MHNAPFTVAGMSSSTSSHHNGNLNNWGSTSTSTSFGDSLNQSRSHYQSGYLMSTSQNNNSPPGNQRVDEVPVVPTKAKLNQVLTRGTTTDFGMESMFQSSRQRQNLADEDAPPISSVNDIPNEVFLNNDSPRFQPRNSTVLESSQFGRRNSKAAPSAATNSQQPVYIIVFGYPGDKYSVTVEYFKSLGESTEADPNTDIVNCFRIGYKDPADAMRAVRKNGDIIGGSWMIGAKWADPAQADALVGQSSLRATTLGESNTNNYQSGNAMAVDEPMGRYSPVHHVDTPTLGTTIHLAPSTSAFKKPTVGVKPAAQASVWGSPSSAPIGGGGGGPNTNTNVPHVQPSPNKTVLGQVSDLIFGW
ncbi:hypothetical protein FA15DRAFT_675767 [Coprinopsis marcescibilis]|uniref:RRM Nup35-type domain-containing protein n=1 Tax=Coprinopsis marcescibilis TaxID=230819 RepID=A0A5C3KCV4_COPMA|nr:hypothetical protein FA15DRAFT_675767 [Coprinopsis marcescibilis]